MADRDSGSGGGSRLSPQTLIVASLASLTAAIVTSTFWRKGTPITAALSPVIVAFASELYSRPAKRIGDIGSRATARTRARRVAPGEPPKLARPQAPEVREQPPGAGPVRIYRAERERGRRRVSPKVVIATAAIAFAIAIVVLTVPELLFGGAAASSERTTFFGGGTGKSHHPKKQQQPPGATTPQTTTTPQQTTTAPQTTTTTPAPTQTAPQTTTPAAPPAAPQGPTSGQAPPGQ